MEAKEFREIWSQIYISYHITYFGGLASFCNNLLECCFGYRRPTNITKANKESRFCHNENSDQRRFKKFQANPNVLSRNSRFLGFKNCASAPWRILSTFEPCSFVQPTMEMLLFMQLRDVRETCIFCKRRSKSESGDLTRTWQNKSTKGWNKWQY